MSAEGDLDTSADGEDDVVGSSDTQETATPSTPAQQFYTKTLCMRILKISAPRFAKLGLIPNEIRRDPWGHGGTVHYYDASVIEHLARNRDEIPQRIQEFEARQAQPVVDSDIGELSVESDWNNIG